jgi:hypothetical protein
MKAKKFDCVEMRHPRAEEVRKKLQGMTKEEERTFWRERSTISGGFWPFAPSSC